MSDSPVDSDVTPERPDHAGGCYLPLYTYIVAAEDSDMRTVDHDDADDRKCWLSDSELDAFLDEPDETERQIALELMGRCGLRKDEVPRIRRVDVVDGPDGAHLQVEGAKGGRHREPPIPDQLVRSIEAYTGALDVAGDNPVVDVSKRTVERWVDRASVSRQSATGDDPWSYFTPHDLRRSWDTLLLEHGVEPGMVMEWGVERLAGLPGLLPRRVLPRGCLS
jgi:integrase